MSRSRPINGIRVSGAAIAAGVEALEWVFPSQFEFSQPLGADEGAPRVLAAMLAADRDLARAQARAKRQSRKSLSASDRPAAPSKRASNRAHIRDVVPTG